MKKVLALMGSPRKGGNSEQLSDLVLNEFPPETHEVKKIYLTDCTIEPCRGCFACRKIDKCIIDDDVNGILEEIKAADVIIVSSPVYFLQVTGQVKQMMDRMFPLLRGAPGKYYLEYEPKDMVMVYALGHGDALLQKDYFPYNQKAFDMMGLHAVDTLVCVSGNALDALDRQPELVARAKAVGRSLAGQSEAGRGS